MNRVEFINALKKTNKVVEDDGMYRWVSIHYRVQGVYGVKFYYVSRVNDYNETKGTYLIISDQENRSRKRIDDPDNYVEEIFNYINKDEI